LSLEDTTNNNYSLSRGRQVYLIKISSGGEILWTNSYGTTLDEKVMDVMELSDGNILICGFREENYVYLFDKPAAWLKKIDSEGNELWTVEFERYYPAQIGEDSAGDIYLAASEMTDTDSYYSYYNHTDARLVKLTSGGTVLWNKLLEP